MTKVKLDRAYILKIVTKRKWTLITNISYKDSFSEKDLIKIVCSCGRPQTLALKSLNKYICPYCNKINCTDFKVCPICEKPHSLKTKCCFICNKTIKELDISIGKVLLLKKYYSKEDIIEFIKNNPYLIHAKTDHKEVLKERREVTAAYNDIEYKKTVYKKYEGEIPLYIKNTLKKHLNVELITISGDKSNPMIHYICRRCNEEQAQSFKNIQQTKGHQCIASKSSGQALVESFLKGKFKYKTEYETLKCINPVTKRQLPYDIEIIDRKVLIEIQGEQHKTFSPYFHGTEENFEYQKRKDSYKKRWGDL